MKKTKRILSLAIVIFLILLYLATLVFALLNRPWAFTMFKACLCMTIVLPVILYVYLWIFRTLNKDS